MHTIGYYIGIIFSIKTKYSLYKFVFNSNKTLQNPTKQGGWHF